MISKCFPVLTKPGLYTKFKKVYFGKLIGQLNSVRGD